MVYFVILHILKTCTITAIKVHKYHGFTVTKIKRVRIKDWVVSLKLWAFSMFDLRRLLCFSALNTHINRTDLVRWKRNVRYSIIEDLIQNIIWYTRDECIDNPLASTYVYMHFSHDVFIDPSYNMSGMFSPNRIVDCFVSDFNI